MTEDDGGMEAPDSAKERKPRKPKMIEVESFRSGFDERTGVRYERGDRREVTAERAKLLCDTLQPPAAKRV